MAAVALRVNLLPHRAVKRERQKWLFFVALGLSAVVGLVLVGAGWIGLETAISLRRAHNEVIAAEIRKLDSQIREIASLRQEIDALRARQKSVEDLQADRAQPVLLFEQLNTQTPDGVFLRSVKQEGGKVLVSGFASSNERISEFMRNLQNNSQEVTAPELIETRLGTLTAPGTQRRLLEFSLSFQLRSSTPVTDKSPRTPAAAAVAPRAVNRSNGDG
jgi:type IV pilus assembly protein PilN